MLVIDRIKRAFSSINLSRKEVWILVSLFVIAFAIRAIGLTWGLPSQNHIYSRFLADEPGVLIATLKIGQGEFETWLTPFFYYMSFVVFGFYFLIGKLIGLFTSLGDFMTQMFLDMSPFLLVGRLFNILLSSATVIFLYFVGRKLFDKTVGLIASVFLLFSFGHIVYAKVFRLDVFLPLIFLITFLLILDLKRDDVNTISYILCGLSLGIAVATKPNSLALLVPLFVSPMMKSKKALLKVYWNKRFLLCLGVFFGTYVILLAPSLMNIGRTLEHISVFFDKFGRFGNAASISPYKHSLVWYIWQILPRSLGTLIYLSAIAGVLLVFLDRKNRSNNLILISAIFAYLLPMGYFKRTNWRDMLPLLPFLCISAAYAVRFAVGKIRETKVKAFAIVGIMIILLLLPIYNIYKQKKLITKKDTRDIAKEWIETNIPSNSRIATEAYAAGIDENIESLARRYRRAVEEWGHANRLGAIIEASQKNNTSSSCYNVFLMFQDLELESCKDMLEPDKLINYLVTRKIEFVVLSSAYYGRYYSDAVKLHYPLKAELGRRFHNIIGGNLILVKQIIPNWQNRPGPVISVYRVPQNLTIQNAAERANVKEFIPFPNMGRPASAVGYYQFSPR